MITVTKIFEFEASHRLPHYDGKCANLHGHSYKLEVTVRGNINYDTDDPKCGMVLDFGYLKRLVNSVIDKYDHAYLNDYFPVPTAENMVLYFSWEIEKVLPKHLSLTKITLWETSNSYATWSK